MKKIFLKFSLIILIIFAGNSNLFPQDKELNDSIEPADSLYISDENEKIDTIKIGVDKLWMNEFNKTDSAGYFQDKKRIFITPDLKEVHTYSDTILQLGIDFFVPKPSFSSNYLGYVIDSTITILNLASICAPIFWYSSDEPELTNESHEVKFGKRINMPKPYPFEKRNRLSVRFFDEFGVFEAHTFEIPVVYYQIGYTEKVTSTKRPAVVPYYEDNAKKIINQRETKIDLSKIENATIYYTHFYGNETGAGSHEFDNEQVQIEVEFERSNYGGYDIKLKHVKAKAHDLYWYDNNYKPNEKILNAVLPVHILVEEGKHASCPDVNADGYYMPGYDVNENVNDAWGVRDVIRTGFLFSSDYQGWMTKIRRPEFKIIPPLPKNSSFHDNFNEVILNEGQFIPVDTVNYNNLLSIINEATDFRFYYYFDSSVRYKYLVSIYKDSISNTSKLKDTISPEVVLSDSTFRDSNYIFIIFKKSNEDVKIFSPNNAVYELRLMPPLSKFNDPKLRDDVKDYVLENSVEEISNNEIIPTEDLINTLSFTYRYDKGTGLAISLPLFLIENWEVPIIYGWVVNKLGWNLRRDACQYNLQYSSSVSRFIDPYFSLGLEFSKHTKPNYVFEAGGKIRLNTRKDAPISLFQIGVGLRYDFTSDIEQINRISTVFEIGIGGF